MRTVYRSLICALFILAIGSSASWAAGPDKDKGGKSAISKGIGNIVSGWAKLEIRGKELAARIHELIAARKAARGKDKGKPDHAGKGGKGKGGKPDGVGKGKGGKPDGVGKGGRGKKGR